MIRNRPHRTRIGAISAVAAVALGLSACGADSEPTASTDSDPESVSGDITLLTPIFEGTAGQKLLEDELLPEFYEEYPNVTVSVDYTTYGNLNEKLTTAAVSGAVPDVMLMGVGWIEGFAERGLIADLSELGLSEDKLLESYTPAIVDAGTWNDGVYAVPIMLDTRFGVARMDLLKEAGYDSPPQSWDELVEMSKALTVRDSSGKLERAGFDMLSLDARQAFETMLFSADGDLFNEDDTAPTFNDEAGVSALQLMSDLINVDEVEDIGFSSADAAVNPLLNGRAAIGIAHNNLWTQGLEAAPDVLDDLEPFVIEGDGSGMFFGGTLATRSATSSSPEAAQAFLEFLASPGPALAANEQRGNVPALSELLESDYVQSNDFVQFAMENLEVAKREGGPPEWLEVRGDFAPAVEAALLDQKTAEDSLNDLAGLVQTAIDR